MVDPQVPADGGDGDDDDAYDIADHTISWDHVDELPPMMGWVGDDTEKAKAFYRRLAGAED